MILLERLGNLADGSSLIKPLHAGVADGGILQRSTSGTALDQQFQFGFLIEALDLPWRIVLIVPVAKVEQFFDRLHRIRSRGCHDERERIDCQA